MSKLIHMKGKYSEWLLPQKLYHGTTDVYLDGLLSEGLKINNENKNSALSMRFIYLTSSIELAKSFANSVAFKKGGKSIILEIDATTIDPDYINFDLNISLRLCTQCMTYEKSIPISKILENLDNIGQATMLFNEPEHLNVPVIWNLSEERTKEHLNHIGWKKQEKVNSKFKK